MKKSYKGLWLWIAVYCAGFIPMMHMDCNGQIVTRLTLLYTAVMLASLMLIIKKYDCIYWINGVAYEDAEKAGYEKRMVFAGRHLKTFAGFAMFYTVFTLICHMLGLTVFIDIAVFTVGLIVTAFSTISITL